MGQGLGRAFLERRKSKRIESLIWHKQCLANHRMNLENLKHEVKRCVANLARSESAAAFYAEQIAAAERQGRAGFDRERFLVKRKAK